MGRPINNRVFGDTAGAGSQIEISARPTAAASQDGFIVAQKGSKRFRCTNADGTATLQLVVTAPAQGECRITLEDSDGGTYFASKISGRTATVTRGTGTQFATGAKVKWSTDAAVENDRLQIAVA